MSVKELFKNYLEEFLFKRWLSGKGFSVQNDVMVNEANKCEHEGFQFTTIWYRVENATVTCT